VAKKAAELMSRSQEGEMLAFADVAIAATAMVHGFILVTRGAKSFKRIEGLKLENY
jgi:predicted nucleic acid-binding protein